MLAIIENGKKKIEKNIMSKTNCKKKKEREREREDLRKYLKR